MKKRFILDLSEDLLKVDPIKATSQIPLAQQKRVIDNKTLVTKPKTLESRISDTAQTLGIDSQELKDWMTEHSVPQSLLKAILWTAQHLRLNPLLGHLAWELNEKNYWEIYISIDGWIAMLHREPKFQGITFNQSSETENGIPIWMECSIFRSDLAHPITVREYFSELKTEHPMWAQMPRRMLRHKTLQQCVRLVFAISISEYQLMENQPNKANANKFLNKKHLVNPKIILKEKLFIGT